jgi:hypothetical protein
VMTAVLQDGHALRYASEALRSDKEVVTAAVMQNGFAINFASYPLYCDPQLRLKAALAKQREIRECEAIPLPSYLSRDPNTRSQVRLVPTLRVLTVTPAAARAEHTRSDRFIFFWPPSGFPTRPLLPLPRPS